MSKVSLLGKGLSRMILVTRTCISRMSLFPMLGVLGGIFSSFLPNFDRTFHMQTVNALFRRRLLWRLICFCSVCLCPTKRETRLTWVNVHAQLSSWARGHFCLSLHLPPYLIYVSSEGFVITARDRRPIRTLTARR